MRVAVVGLGIIGELHIKVIRETENELVAVCDTDAKRLSLYADVRGYVDYATMLDEAKPDVVHVCTPHYLHTEMIIAALKRNINVLCEKPVCIRKEDVPLILEAERNSAAQLGVCFQNRYNASTVFVKEYLKDKEIIGAHGRMMWHRDQAYYMQAEWRGTQAQEGGGVLINQALHTVDLLQWFMGIPQTVIGWCANLSLKNVIEVEDTATLICRGEKEYSLSATNAATKDFPVEIIFKTKTDQIRMFGDSVYINDKYYDYKSLGELYGKQVYGYGHCELIHDFYECIKTGRKFSIDGAESVKAVKIVLAAYESYGDEIRCE